MTGEDIKKTAIYQAERLRKAERATAVSAEDFLKKLEMTMEFHFMTSNEEKRVTQLVNKTNQFNVTTKRYSEEEIHRLSTREDWDIFTVHMADKYGDQGLVAVLILKYERKRAEIDTFLMSCRVMGRNAENEIMAQLKVLLMQKGIQTIKASYIKTAKNAPVMDLFETLGFLLVSGKIQKNGDEKVYEANTTALPETTGIFKMITMGE